jgi:Domain of unknown function (DUF4281)
VTGPVTIGGMLESIFSACSSLALLGWALLVFLPRQRHAHLLAAAGIPLAISVVYLVLIAQHFGRSEGGFGSLSDVAQLFSNPALLLAGWVHYLAFDLFIGAWESRDAQRHGIPHLLVVPCLLLTFMLGPIGLLTYWALRTWRTRSVQLTPES